MQPVQATRKVNVLLADMCVLFHLAWLDSSAQSSPHLHTTALLALRIGLRGSREVTRY